MRRGDAAAAVLHGPTGTDGIACGAVGVGLVAVANGERTRVTCEACREAMRSYSSREVVQAAAHLPPPGDKVRPRGPVRLVQVAAVRHPEDEHPLVYALDDVRRRWCLPSPDGARELVLFIQL